MALTPDDGFVKLVALRSSLMRDQHRIIRQADSREESDEQDLSVFLLF